MAVAGTQSRVMTRRNSDTLKCRKAPYILNGCAVYLTELLVAHHVAPDVIVVGRLIGDASRCLPGGTEDNREKSLTRRSNRSEALWREASCSQF